VWANVTRAGLKWRFVCLCSVQTKQRAVSSKLPVRLVEFLHTANGQNYLARNRKAEVSSATEVPQGRSRKTAFSPTGPVSGDVSCPSSSAITPASDGASTISPSDWAISAGFSRHTGRIVQCHEEAPPRLSPTPTAPPAIGNQKPSADSEAGERAFVPASAPL